MNSRVPVLNPDGSAAMPTKSSRARRWVQDGKAIGKTVLDEAGTKGQTNDPQDYVQLCRPLGNFV